MAATNSSIRQLLPHTRIIGPSIYYHRRVNGKLRQTKIGRLAEPESALRAKYAAIAGNTEVSLTASESAEMSALIRDKWRTMNVNAKKRGIPVLIAEREFYEMFRRTGGRCEITGIPFSLANQSGAKRRPFVPSIDRIDSSGPYSAENCRIVLCLVNIAMNEWGLDALQYVAARIPLRADLNSAPAAAEKETDWDGLVSQIRPRDPTPTPSLRPYAGHTPQEPGPVVSGT